MDLSEKQLEEFLRLKKLEKKKGRFSKFIVVFVILLNVVFTAAVFYTFLQTAGNEPTELIRAWFAFTTVELWSLSKITREEKRRETSD